MPLTFHEGFPERLAYSFDHGIFHDINHLQLQTPLGWHGFYIRNEKTIEGVFHVHLGGGVAVSPYRSPFGSFLVSESVPVKQVREFVLFCEEALKKLKIETLTLKNPPEAYLDQNKTLTDVLVQNNYLVLSEETSAVIAITKKIFDTGLHKSEKKRLRKCRERNLKFEIIPSDRLQKVYAFLEACREEKGYTLSMTFEEIQKLVDAFPQRVMLTAVVDGQNLAAANVSIRVYDRVLYNFYHDHTGEYDNVSPVVLLNEGLYSYCQRNEIAWLDLGTSNINGKLNESLFNFKLNLGAIPSRKITFVKKLAS